MEPLTELSTPDVVDTGVEPNVLRYSNHAQIPSAAGAAMWGIQMESRTDCAIREIKEASEWTCTMRAAQHKAAVEANLVTDHLLGIVQEADDPLSFQKQ